MNIIEKIKQNPNLYKHSATIHITNKINLLQRKLYNVLLKNAFDDMDKNNNHKISVSDLSKIVGFNSNNTKVLKIALTKLRETGIDINILGKDNKNNWTNVGLCSRVQIDENTGMCSYGFDSEFVKMFKNPNIFANLNLDIQQKFKSKHSIAIWELCIEELSVNKSDSIYTKNISIDDFKKLLFLSEDKFSQFKHLNYVILKPSILEINLKSDIDIILKTKKEGRKITHISFFVKRKNINLRKTTFSDDLKEAEEKYLEQKKQKKSSVSSNKQEKIIEGGFEEIKIHNKEKKRNQKFTQEEIKNAYSELLSEDKKNNPIETQYPFNLNRIDELINLGISKKDIEKEFNKLSQEIDNFSEDNIENLLDYFLNQDDVKNVISGKREVKSKPSYIFTLIKNRSFLNQETLIKIIKKSETYNQKEEKKESLTKKYQIRNAEPFWQFISNYLDLKRAEDWGKILKFELLNFSLIEDRVMYLILSKSNDNSKDKFHRDNLLREKENLILTINKMLQMDVFKDIGQINNLKISIEDEYSFRC